MTEPLTTKAADFWQARKEGRRLPEHELRCIECGELSEAPVCGACIETQLEAQNYERTREAH